MTNSKRDQSPFAVSGQNSRGRETKEPAPESRTEFERDRDRVLHSKAFRRLQYKTQVFASGSGDLFRTRLTHSLEVAQIGCSMAAGLGVNEALTEAICLAHDLGHPPFGHAGQDALSSVMKGFGGFEHNLQALRVVGFLERGHARFDGLNLLFETREGLLKRCPKEHLSSVGSLAERFEKKQSPSLEAQAANQADEIAYCCHDLDDAAESGLVPFEEALDAVPFLREMRDVAVSGYGALDDSIVRAETIRALVGWFVTDVMTTSQRAIGQSGVASIDDVRNSGPLVSLSNEGLEVKKALKVFLMGRFYRHRLVSEKNEEGMSIISGLFPLLLANQELLPARFFANGATPERGVCDYVAGMTDIFAKTEFERLSRH